MRKEYNDRWNSPLVNPPITHGEYEAQRAADSKQVAKEIKHVRLFVPTIDGVEAKVS